MRKIEISPCFKRREGDLENKVAGRKEEAKKATPSKRSEALSITNRWGHPGKQTRPQTPVVAGAATTRRGIRRSLPGTADERDEGRCPVHESGNRLLPHLHHTPATAVDEEEAVEESGGEE